MKFIIFLIFFCSLTIQQYQQCTHLSGSGTNSEQHFGITGKYSNENNIGGVAESTSFLINSNSEILIFFGTDFSSGSSDQIWKYSIEKRQWQFVKGRKMFNKNAIFNSIGTFNETIQIGSRYSTKGWINEDIATFFGGYGYQRVGSSVIRMNEVWRYNLSSNAYSVIQCNNCDDVTTSNPLTTQLGTINQFDSSTNPGGRETHEIVVLNNEEVFLIGGKGDSGIFADYYIFSTKLFQWKYLGGGGVYNVDPNYGETNTYSPTTSIGSTYGASRILINEEEILMFGGRSKSLNLNTIFKFNITKNNWKYVSGDKGVQQSIGKGYLRNYDASNYPSGRLLHKLWRKNNNELILFGGWGYPQQTSTEGLLNDEWHYNIKLNLWKFSGKEKSKYINKEPYFNNNEYSDDTIIGGLSYFVGEYIEEKLELIICNGKGRSLIGNDDVLDDCWSIYHGKICDSIQDTDPNVCLGRGNCSNYNQCECQDDYFGPNCELTKCNGILSNETETVCSGIGICFESQCLCYTPSQFNNLDCTINTEKQKAAEDYQQFVESLWIIFTVPTIIVVIVSIFSVVAILFLFIFCKQKKNLKKFNEIEDVDIILEEQKIAKDSSIAHFKINQKMFEIDPKDIKIIEKIGQGGSSAVVYSAMWNNQKVAYKCFIVQDFLENKFQEFEKEVELLSSINFPFILTFYGATLNSQRLGFVMEFAKNGDLEHFLRNYKKKNRRSYPILKKIRMLYEISSAMAFLHKKKIIHRDLKPLNVLVTSKEETKLMDFGLSKIIDNDLTKTKKIGTSFFIAPEVLIGKYSFPCDVFSFAMLMFVVLTENQSPFGKSKEFNICLKISKDPKFRPNLKKIEENKEFKKIEGIKSLIERNWSHESENRMTFEEICQFLSKILGKKNEVDWEEEFRKLKSNFEKKEEEINKLKKEIQKIKGSKP